MSPKTLPRNPHSLTAANQQAALSAVNRVFIDIWSAACDQVSFTCSARLRGFQPRCNSNVWLNFPEMCLTRFAPVVWCPSVTSKVVILTTTSNYLLLTVWQLRKRCNLPPLYHRQTFLLVMFQMMNSLWWINNEKNSSVPLDYCHCHVLLMTIVWYCSLEIREITPMSCPFSPYKPFRVRRCAIGNRSSPWRTHEVDMHCLFEERGNQSEDASWLVLHARKGERCPTQQDPRRSQLCHCTCASFLLSVFHTHPLCLLDLQVRGLQPYWVGWTI